MRRLASSVLVFEALIVLFALPVAVRVNDADPVLAGIGAGVLVVAAVLITGLLRYRSAYIAGSVLQLLLIATGLVVPMMYFLGAVFAGLWVAAIWLGLRVTGPDAR